ncbi:UGSC family (seleno)protein [Solwaraspora sp. WMMB335]|uniref:UGSC family (seleno)protein n=1 Tax=Solwaraspora sp. WMMB335 TaxID=3404118 RepID=UPI003B9404BD
MLDPTGFAERSADHTLAPRPASLRGITVGLLDNTKANAVPLLQEFADELRRRYNIGECRLYTKDYFGTPVKDELLKQIVAECNLLVTAIGDCGSCSAATVADGILFERAGLPAVSICSDSFRTSGRAMAKLQGFPGYRFLVVQHPVASIDAAQIRDRVRDAMPELLTILGVEA